MNFNNPNPISFTYGKLNSYILQNSYKNSLDDKINSYITKPEEYNSNTQSNYSFIDDLFQDKTDSSKSLIKEIQKEISQRDKLLEDNLLRIDYSIIYTRDMIHAMETCIGYVPAAMINRQRSFLELQIGNLYKEKRDQYLQSFRDKIFLKKDLFMALKDYWAAKRETELFDTM